MTRKRYKKDRPILTKEQITDAVASLTTITKKSIKQLYKKMIYIDKGGFSTVYSAQHILEKHEYIALKKIEYTGKTTKSDRLVLAEIYFLKNSI